MPSKTILTTLLGLIGTLMLTALVAAQQSLAAMKDHMGPCMNMMSMMEQMQSGMGGQMQKKK